MNKSYLVYSTVVDGFGASNVAEFIGVCSDEDRAKALCEEAKVAREGIREYTGCKYVYKAVDNFG